MTIDYVNLRQTKKLLRKSYTDEYKIRRQKNLELDNKLTGNRVKVHYNKKTGKAFVVHRGTASLTDWVKTDIPLIFGYEGGSRFKHARKIQKLAEKKYGKENVVTLGHSLGGRIAEKVGKKSSKIITYNKAASPFSILNPTPENQIDIRTTNDPVSYLANFQKNFNKTVKIASKTLNLLKEHSLSVLPNTT